MNQELSDRNLVLGVLALQLNFIARKEFIASLRCWHANMHESFGRLLVETGLLSEHRLKLLEDLVSENLRQHAQRAGDSLSALRAASDDLHDALTEAASVLTAGSAVEDETPPLPTLPAGTSAPMAGHRFNILRPHARGGMGQVSVAVDTQLNRHVALKEMKAPFAQSQEHRTRFMREAQITGALEHPGVVPVYALETHHPRGPFYAMRLIQGDSLAESIKQYFDTSSRDVRHASIQFRQLLHRFVDVCNTVSYAHSRAVLHRDLKPANVMVGDYGETLVVDWGLAKTIHSNDPSEKEVAATIPDPVHDPMTVAGSTAGTPAYMSPEQAAGRADLQGPASDIYSLGATLYHLLTGQPSVAGTHPEQILERVSSGDIPRPRAIRRDVPPPLDSICMKAMALEPANRYATVKELADDLEAWLADEPVSVHPGSLGSRAGRWARHHRALVTSSVVLLLTALVGLVVGTILLGRANHEIETQRDLARDNAHEARLQQRVAQQNYQDARQAVDDYLTKVSQTTLLKVPGMQPLRRELLSTALKYNLRFVERHRENPEMRADLAKSYMRVGEITLDLDSIETALQHFTSARQILESLRAVTPGDQDVCLELGTLYNAIGTVYSEQQQFDAALAMYRESKSLRESQLAGDAPLIRHDVATTQANIGRVHLMAGKPAEAVSEYAQACAALGKLLETHSDHPDADDLRRSLVAMYEGLGLAHARHGDDRDALAAYEAGLEVGERLLDKNAEDLVRRTVASLLNGRAGMLKRQPGQRQAAIRDYLRAIQIIEELARINPVMVQFQADLAAMYGNLADTLTDAERQDEALAANENARRILMRLIEMDADRLSYQTGINRCDQNIGSIHWAGGRREEALDSYRSVLSRQQRLAETFPDTVANHVRVAISHATIGYFLSQMGQPVEERAHYQDALEIRLRIAEHNPDFAENRDGLIQLYRRIGTSYRTNGNQTEAIQAYREGLRLAEQRSDENPYRLDYSIELARIVVSLGTSHGTAGNPGRATSRYGEAIRILGLVRQNESAPDNAQLLLANTHELRAGMLVKLEQIDDAIADWEKAIQLDEAGALGPRLKVGLTLALARGGQHQRSVELANDIADEVQTSGSSLYNLACACSIAASVAGSDPTLSEEEQAKRSESHVQRAIQFLDAARQEGYFKDDAAREQLDADSDLEFLRIRPEFKRFVSRLSDE